MKIELYKYEKPKSRPVVSFSLAHDFNETTVMDVKQFRNVYILHLNETRFSVGVIFHLKRKKVIIDNKFKYWIILCDLFLSQNGEEIKVARVVNIKLGFMG